MRTTPDRDAAASDAATVTKAVLRAADRLDLTNNAVLKRDIDSSTPPAPGTQEHRNLVGKLVFFTALGVPDVLDTNNDKQFDIVHKTGLIEPVPYPPVAFPGWSCDWLKGGVTKGTEVKIQ